jgi:hypothetical protein
VVSWLVEHLSSWAGLLTELTQLSAVQVSSAPVATLRKAAVQVGQMLIDAELIGSLTKGHPFADRSYFYRHTELSAWASPSASEVTPPAGGVSDIRASEPQSAEADQWYGRTRTHCGRSRQETRDDGQEEDVSLISTVLLAGSSDRSDLNADRHVHAASLTTTTSSASSSASASSSSSATIDTAVSQWCVVRYQPTLTPGVPFFLELHWLVAGTDLLRRFVQSIGRRARVYSMRLTQIPLRMHPPRFAAQPHAHERTHTSALDSSQQTSTHHRSPQRANLPADHLAEAGEKRAFVDSLQAPVVIRLHVCQPSRAQALPGDECLMKVVRATLTAPPLNLVVFPARPFAPPAHESWTSEDLLVDPSGSVFFYLFVHSIYWLVFRVPVCRTRGLVCVS